MSETEKTEGTAEGKKPSIWQNIWSVFFGNNSQPENKKETKRAVFSNNGDIINIPEEEYQKNLKEAKQEELKTSTTEPSTTPTTPTEPSLTTGGKRHRKKTQKRKRSLRRKSRRRRH
jgi:hypothetical protein